MDSGDQVAAVAESATAPASQPTDTSAGTQNTDQGQQPAPEVPFHQHPRFQQLIQRSRTAEERAVAAERRAQELERRFQTLESKANGPARTPEEVFERQRAQQALEDLFGDHPKFGKLLKLADHADQLLQTPQAVQEHARAQAEAQLRTAVSHIRSLAEKAGYPTDDEALNDLRQLVAARARALPDGEARYMRGDMSVLDDAFKALTGGWLGKSRVAQATNVIATKNNVRNLPPAPRGGGPGQEPPATLESVGGDERKFFSKLREAASAKLGAAGR